MEVSGTFCNESFPIIEMFIEEFLNGSIFHKTVELFINDRHLYNHWGVLSNGHVKRLGSYWRIKDGDGIFTLEESCID